MKGYRVWDPRQAHLLPPSPMDWLSEDHVVYFVLDAISELDLSAIEHRIQSKDSRGTRPFPPRMMVGLLLYGYCVGVISSRKLEAATYNDVGFRVLCSGNHPDHSTISEFRKRFDQELAGLFVQVLRMCQESGLVKLGHVALDGTKMQGNASKHKAMSYERMKKAEEELEAEIRALLEKAAQADAAEDGEFGPDARGDELPEELRTREARRRKLRQARQALEAEAARAHAEHKRALAKKAAEEAAEAEEATSDKMERRAQRCAEAAEKAAARAVAKAKDRVNEASERTEQLNSSATTAAEKRALGKSCDELADARAELAKAEELAASGDSEADQQASSLPEHHIPFDRHGNPQPKAQRNFTDADSKIVKTGDGYIQGFNCQAAVDEESQVIVGQAATNQPPDQEHLRPLLDQTIENCGSAPDKLTADAGYWSAENAAHCESIGTDAYIAPDRKPKSPAQEDADTEQSRARQSMRAKVASDAGREIYAKRKWVVEPVFGQVKEARGFRRFLRRGISAIRAEWALVCTAHNLLKLFKAESKRKAAAPAHA